MKTSLQYKSSFNEGDLPKGMSWDYFLSRKGLSILTGLDFSDLEIENHLHLKKQKKTLVSLAHTKGAAAAAISKQENILSIGIDIESKKRQIKEAYKKFFVNELDQYDDLLILWVKKEAAFKALSPLINNNTISLNKVFVLTDIWVNNDHFGLKNSYNKLGEFEYFEDSLYYIITSIVYKDGT